MTGSPADAVAAARTTLDISAREVARVWDVWDPDDDRLAYRLVEFGRPDTVVGIAMVGVVDSDVMSSARLPGTGPHLTVSDEDARTRAGRPGALVRLVWRASRASRSPLYPIWEVRSGSERVYVDMTGRVWQALEAGGPGGSAAGDPPARG